MPISSFLETQFPTDISNNSKGGPGYLTHIISVDSGFEQRNSVWPYPRHGYDASYGVRTAAQMEVVVRFFNVMRGRATGFRYKDPLDHKSCSYDLEPTWGDQVLISSAAGGETTAQLYKSYSLGGQATIRPITKPVTGTVVVGKNGGEMSSGWTIDTTTGIITFDTPLVATDSITAGYYFDVPCRFATDELNVEYEGPMISDATIQIIEVRVV